MNPRTEFDTLGTLVCFHKDYSLGDKTELKSGMFTSWDDLERHLFNECNAAIALPLYLYDHSGITIRTHPFGCRWDSGQIGFIYLEKDKLLKWYNREKITRQLLKSVEKDLISEVELYNHYLTGQVFGYVVRDEKGVEVDSCWGFYGDDEFVLNEAKSYIDCKITQEEKEGVVLVTIPCCFA